MAELLEPQDIMFTPFEPKLKNRFMMQIDGINAYLIKSINEFYTQDELANLMTDNGFSNVEYRNLSNGISAIHSGWKV